MNIRQLRYFVQIVDSGSLSAAARALHVAQPALSQQIAKLEDEVGKPLLNRSSVGVRPTENGLSLYHHALFMLRQFDQSIDIARGNVGALQGVVTVGLPATTVAAIGLPLARRVRECYPNVMLNVVEGMSGHISQLMRLNMLDIAVLFGHEAMSDAIIEPLMIEELFLILAQDTDLVPPQADRISLAEVSDIPLILPTRNHGLRQRIDAAFENRGLSVNVVAQVDSLSLVMDCVHDGMGATIKPMGAIMKEGAGGRRFRPLGFLDHNLKRRNYLYSQPADRMTPAATAVLAEIRSAVRELIENGAWAGFEAVGDEVAPDLAAI